MVNYISLVNTDKRNLLLLVVVVFFGSAAHLSNNNPTASNVPTIHSKSHRRLSDLPQVAWLLSFPNSGTTYTMRLVQRTTKTTVATFYGSESVDRSDGTRFQKNSIPLSADMIDGPFLVSDLDIPKGGYILSKTHCGGWCFSSSCKPHQYVVSPEKFLEGCVTGARMEHRDNKDGYEKIRLQYDPSMIKKAVHMMRNPLDNIISRFHLERSCYTRHVPFIKWDEEYENNPNGFKKWCQATDKRNFPLEKKLMHKGIIKMLQNVPCHGEFFRYVQWHNHAFSVTNLMNISSHVVYYEEYGRDQDKTVLDLLNFVDQPWVGEVPKFKMKRYEGYYTDKERENIFEMLRQLASVDTYHYLTYYMSEDRLSNIMPSV